MKTQLCKCNNCDTVMIDRNPSDQPELTAPDNVQEMVQLPDGQHNYFWGCPVCKTDDYLTDLSIIE